jgi:CheY-like chemotaxis protein
MKDKSILIVERDAIVTLHLLELLNKTGYDVVEQVISGEDAIAYLKKFSPPDLILIDTSLDGNIDGIETTRLIQQNYDIPIVFLSPPPVRNTPDMMFSPSGFITKPFIESEVLSTIEKALGKRLNL